MRDSIQESIKYWKSTYPFLSTESTEIWIQGDGNEITISWFEDMNHLKNCIRQVRRVRNEIAEFGKNDVYHYLNETLDEIENNLVKRFKRLSEDI